MAAPVQTQHGELLQSMEHPINVPLLLRKRRLIRELLLERGPLVKRRIAILGGSTTADVRAMLELFLLRKKITVSKALKGQVGGIAIKTEIIRQDQGPLAAFRAQFQEWVL